MAASKGGRPSGGGGGFSRPSSSSSSFGSKGTRPSSSPRPSSFGGSNISGSRPSPSRPSQPSSRPSAPFHPPHPTHYYRPARRAGGGFLGGLLVGSMIHRNNGGNTTNSYYNDGQQQYPPQYQQQPAQPLTDACPYCGTTYKQGDSKCPSCGASVPPLTANNANAGYYAPPSAGAYAPPPQTAYGAQARPRKKKNNVFGFLVAAFIAAVAVIIVVSLLSGPKTYTKTVGQAQTTKWFGFTVTGYKVTDNNYKGEGAEYTPPAANLCAVVVDLSIMNTTDETLEFYSDDFLLRGDNYVSEDDYEPKTEDSLYQYFDKAGLQVFRFITSGGKKTFTVGAKQTLKGRLIYVIPTNVKKAKLDYTEYNENSKKGNSYIVNLF